MKKRLIGFGIIILLVAIAIGAGLVWAILHSSSETMSAVEGRVLDVAQSARTIFIEDGNGREITLALTQSTRLFDENQSSTPLTYIRRGFVVRAQGRETESVIIPESVQVVKTPNIIVFAPRPDTEVGLPLEVQGEARVFENQFTVRLKDEDDSILVERNVTAQSEDAGLYGPFAVSLSYPKPGGKKGSIEVFDYSAKDGSEVDKVIVPVVFREVPDMEVQVFFGNSERTSSSTFDCTSTYPVARRVPKSDAPASAALQELLKGPSTTEAKDGYFSSINPGVGIQSLAIQDGTAHVDFSKALEEAVGGSCRVAAIRAQITETLKQFSTVEDVVISIDGRTEDILQP